MSTAQLYVAGSGLQPVTGRPYSADETVEHTQNTPDGTDIKRTLLKAALSRDSAGRTRTETTVTSLDGAVGASDLGFVEIIDPVGHYRYVLDPGSRTARRSAWAPPTKLGGAIAVAPQSGSRSGAAKPGNAVDQSPTSSSTSATATTRESLGAQNIEGLATEGTLTTTTVPLGVVGNKKAFTTTSENWISPELKIVVLARTSDMRYGETTVTLTNISQNEPDPSLFQVPTDYSIVE